MSDYSPDYSNYSLDVLLYIIERIDRIKYPEKAQMINDEIERRRNGGPDMDKHPVATSAQSVPGKHPQINESPTELPLEFHGRAHEYFRIWIVNLCLTLLTLGIFSAWAKVRKKRYLYSHTTIGGTPLQYLARPVPILKGRVIAAVGFLTYYTSTHFITSILPYVLAAGLVVAPWVLVRSSAFNARYSAFRNMTFHFNGGYLDAAKTLYAWGLVPVYFICLIFDLHGKEIIIWIVSIIFAFMFPWWMRRLKNFIISHTSYGGISGEFSAKGSQFFKIYFISGIILLCVVIPISLFAGIITALTKDMTVFYIAMIPIYAGYILSYAYLTAHIGNLVWNNTGIGPIRFESTMRSRELAILYITNALGIIFSIGVLTPWAVMRTMKYRADHMQVFQHGVLSEFRGSDMSAVDAVGAEAIDFFDLDLSL